MYISLPALLSTTTSLKGPINIASAVSTVNGLGNTYLSTTLTVQQTADDYVVSTLPIPPGTYSNGIAVFSNILYYGSQTTLYSYNIVSKAITQCSTVFGNIKGIAASPSYLYVTDTHSIKRVTIDLTTVTPIANTPNTFGFSDGTDAATVQFGNPYSLVIDSTYCNLYVSDYGNGYIRRVQLNPLSVTTIATVPSPVGLAIDSANKYLYAIYLSNTCYKLSLFTSNYTSNVTTFNAPNAYGLCIDQANTLYMTTAGANKLYSFPTSFSGSTIVAGSGTALSKDGIGIAASFNSPQGICFNPTDMCLYTMDSIGQVIRRITTPLYQSTINGLTLLATASNYVYTASLTNPVTNRMVCSFSPPTLPVTSGLTYWLDGADPFGTGIVPANGTITTWVDKSTNNYSNALYNLTYSSNAVTFNGTSGILTTKVPSAMQSQSIFVRFTPSSLSLTGYRPIIGANYNNPNNGSNGAMVELLVKDGAITMGISQPNSNPYQLLSSNSSTQSVSTLKNTSGLSYGICVNSAGLIYFSDSSHHVIYTLSGTTVTPLAGSFNSSGFSDGTGTNAKFFSPMEITLVNDNTILVADAANHRIRQVTSSGVVTTVFGTGNTDLESGYGYFVYDLGIYINTDPLYNLFFPYGVYYSSYNSTVYISDSAHHRIVYGNLPGTGFHILAGGAYYGQSTPYTNIWNLPTDQIYSGSNNPSGTQFGGEALFIYFNFPTGITGRQYDSSSILLYIVDYDNKEIRTLIVDATDPFANGVTSLTPITTTGSPGYGIAIDPSTNNLYYWDNGNSTLYMQSGSTNTVLTNKYGNTDGPLTSAAFANIGGMYIRGSNIYITDVSSQTIRLISYPIIPLYVSGSAITTQPITFSSTVALGTNIKGYYNGTLNFTSNISYTLGSDYLTIGYFTYNNGSAVTSYYAGTISELLIYNSVLNDTDRQSVETYLTTKWTPTAAQTTTSNLYFTTNQATLNATTLIGNNMTAKTFTASNGRSGGADYGFYYGDGTHITNTSDSRLKENIRTIPFPLEKVKALQAVHYRMINDPSRKWIGYIAQDVEPILPSIVRTDSNGWKSIQYTQLPALAIEAIKELKEKYDRIQSFLST